jgi:glycosyltransferase involved in cell wall biosynthesis
MDRVACVIVTAFNEAERLAATLDALALAFPGARLWVADDGSTDRTPEIARAAGAELVRLARMEGKGEAATATARQALNALDDDGQLGDNAKATVVVLCDGDLGKSALRLQALAAPVLNGEADLAVAAFSRRVGGGLGIVVGFAGWAIRRRTGLTLAAPISGQRALSAELLARLLPFAHGFGMEVSMTIDAARGGARIAEVELDLEHRVSGLTVGGFLHRARQLLDIVRACLVHGSLRG